MNNELLFSVSEFVAVFNQTLETAYSSVTIVGELSNYRVSKNRWVYFDLKDEIASLKFFGSVYNLPGPLEDGLVLQVRGQPRLHPQFGFSVNVISMQPVGEGSLRRAVALVESKLRAEGLFNLERKRTLAYPPLRIGLITSDGSAAYHDFIKILDERWGGVTVMLADVQVQGEAAPEQILRAIAYFNEQVTMPEVLVVTRGGGSSEDLAAFNTEAVTIAVATSRIPTLVAIGHEVDISLAEMAADLRASTPSNAAQLLVPDKHSEISRLQDIELSLGQFLSNRVINDQTKLKQHTLHLNQIITQHLLQQKLFLSNKKDLLSALSPKSTLKRGYAIIRKNQKVIKSGKTLKTNDLVNIQLIDAEVKTKIEKVILQ